jgi:tRNA uridine 5-carbamoylmethylation protein Kti12
METAIARNMARGAMVPEDRLRGIFASFEEPARALRIDTDTLSPEAAVATILETVG